ncbi:MAG: hypothetical protein KKB20_08115 [Proteobacteria bacterium]|nr:hypothetical protein [Pseudomonadota bacterium]
MSNSGGGIIGGVIGGVIGWFVGGPTGAYLGAAIGFGLTSGVADIGSVSNTESGAGSPDLAEFSINTCEEGLPIPDVLGTTKITGNIIWHCCERAEAIVEQREVGTGGGGGKGGGGEGGGTAVESVTVGYKYYMTWAVAVCLGPVDTLHAIYKNDDIAYEGPYERADAEGQSAAWLAFNDFGTFTFYYGTDDQDAEPHLVQHVGADLNPPMRGLCYCFVHDCYVGTAPRVPTLSFVVQKCPEITMS